MQANMKHALDERRQEQFGPTVGNTAADECLDTLDQQQLQQVSGGVWVREVVEDVEAY